jgi:hypothetical protein
MIFHRCSNENPALAVAALLLAGIAAGCGGQSVAKGPGSALAEADPLRVLGHLRSRDHWLTIYSSPDGPRFTVAGADGRELEHALSLEDLEARHPELSDLYRGAVASGEGLLDARVLISPAGRVPAARAP